VRTHYGVSPNTEKPTALKNERDKRKARDARPGDTPNLDKAALKIVLIGKKRKFVCALGIHRIWKDGRTKISTNREKWYY